MTSQRSDQKAADQKAAEKVADQKAAEKAADWPTPDDLPAVKGPEGRLVPATDPRESHPREPSLAETERRRWNKTSWAVFIVALFVVIIVPYWGGRVLALNETESVISLIRPIDPHGMALISWTVTVVLSTSLAMALMESRKVYWRVLFLIAFAVEQLICGVGLLRLNFWNSTYVVYGDAAAPINASNIGVIGAAVGVAVFAVVYVGLLVCIRKDSPLNILTRSWSALTLFFVIEIIALLFVEFSGLSTLV